MFSVTIFKVKNDLRMNTFFWCYDILSFTYN
jgi:hypothetical protein